MENTDMKHYFVINPIAGKANQTESLSQEIKQAFEKYSGQYEIYVSQAPGDAERYVREKVSTEPCEKTFYACGGDGTTFEVANGLIGAPNVHLGVIAIGSCNDLLKNFPEFDFLSVERAINGSHKMLDVLKVNDRYSVNVINIGFDARTNADCCNYKKRIKKIKTAYNLAIVKNLITKMSRKIIVTGDGKPFFDGKMLLATFANGAFYGGGYKCAPNALVDDGLMEMTVVRAVSRFKFISFIKYYKDGSYINNPKLTDVIAYRRAQKVVIEAEKPFEVCIDGENYLWQRVEIEILNKQLSFVLPRI